MKLYYTPGTCSMAPHIILKELGMAHTLVRVDIQNKKLEDGSDFLKINPKGAVPVLELDNGEYLTEGPAVMQYLADLKPEAGLIPANGTLERVRVQEALNFVTSELHKTFVPLFNEHYCCDKQKEAMINRLKDKFAVADKLLEGKEYFANGQFSPADAYLYNVSRWLDNFGISRDEWPNVKALFERVHNRPTTQDVIKTEKLKG